MENIKRSQRLDVALTGNVLVDNTAAETDILKSGSLMRLDISSGFNFVFEFAGIASTSGATSPLTIRLRYGDSNTGTPVLEIASTFSISQTDKAFRGKIYGRIEPGSTDAIVATGELFFNSATPATVYANTAIGGTATDFAGANSLNELRLTAQWTAAASARKFDVMYARLTVIKTPV